jgi:hypothetical protein
MLDNVKKTCTMPDCPNPHKAKGLCGKHYLRLLKYGDPNVIKKTPIGVVGVAKCAVGECDDLVKYRDWCDKHYQRWLKHGDAEKVLSVQDHRPAAERWKDRYVVDIFTGCWMWTSYTAGGYGVIAADGIDVRAHRFVYEQLVGPIPDDSVLDHLCHNSDPDCAGGETCPHRRCVNPSHLEPVTFTVNVMRGKGPGAVNARKTECAQGHEYTPENTYIRTGGERQCRACTRRWQREYRARKKAQRAAELNDKQLGA